MKENIFSGLFNRVFGFFRQAEKEETAKDTAVNRLRVVLMQDRTNLTPELMEKMRKELVELLSKYVEMDKDALELNLEQEGDQMALMLSIPVIRAKDEDEIEAATAEESEVDENSKEDEIQSEDENKEEDESAEELDSEDEQTDADYNAEEDEAAEETEETENAETEEKSSKKNKSK